MDCKKIEQVIFRFLYDEASIEELRHIKVHLDKCGHCRRESEMIADILNRLKDCLESEPVPEDLKSRVLSRIQAEKSG